MNYSDVRRWWSTLNDRGFICPVEKWSIVWSNWPIEYFWVFLNIFQYFWIFLRISDYFLVFLNMFEDFLNIFPLFRGEEVHIVWPSWPITIFPRQHHHWLLILIQAPLLDPFSSSKIQNGLEWTLLRYLEWKSIQLTSQSCWIYREFYTLEISWWNCHPM